MYSVVTNSLKATLTFISVVLCLISAHPVAAQLEQPIIRYETIHQPQVGYYGMVVSQNNLASLVGRNILQQGGNAIDAAVAMGFALAVTLPRAGNIGGSGFMLVHLASEGKTIALDYRSMAPLSASDEKNRTASGEINWDKLTFGPNASGVPGTVAGLHEAWKRYGSKPWAELLQPAFELASNGFPVSSDLFYALNQAGKVLADTPSTAAVFIRPDGYVWQPGQKLIQKDLAWSIQQIQQGGADAFYRGELAQRITDAFAKDGQQISMSDLAAYKVKERKIVSTRYRDYEVVSMPPSSAGGITLIQMLNIMENFNVRDMEAGSAKQIHLMAEVMKRAAANRRTHIGDPDFVEVFIDGYTSKKLAKKMAGDIHLKKSQKVSRIKPEPVEEYESRDTTHFSVMDAQGNAVSNTYTLGYSFGSGWVAQGTGILFDNQMRNFYISNSAEGKNAFAPGKRMISTMTPTMVLDKEGNVFVVTGTPGGSRIINTIFQLVVNVIDFKMNIADATQRRRIQQGWNSQTLRLERGFSPDTIEILEKMGHEIVFENTMGSTQSIMWRDGKFYGSADSRRPNASALGVIFSPEIIAKAASGN